MATIFDMELNDADEDHRQQDSLEDDSDDHRDDHHTEPMENDIEVKFLLFCIFKS